MGTHELTTKFNPQKYIKLITMIAGAVASALFAVTTTGGKLGPAEYVNLAIAAVAAFQVWYVTETADNPNGKSVIAFVAAALTAASSLLVTHGSLGTADWAQILVAALSATGLLVVPAGVSAARKALPASYANNTSYVVNAGTPHAESTDTTPNVSMSA